MGDWGFKVSKSGYDVKTATDKQLVFSSSFSVPKIYMQGATVGNSGTVQITHSLGYIPGFLVFAEARNGEMWLLHTYWGGTIVWAGSTQERKFRCKADNDKIYIDSANLTASEDIYYYVLVDPTI